MKPVAYHRLAVSELIKSAKFYERRNPTLGEAFPLHCGSNAAENSAQSRARQNRQDGNAQSEDKAIPVPNCLSGKPRSCDRVGAGRGGHFGGGLDESGLGQPGVRLSERRGGGRLHRRRRQTLP